MWLGETIFRPLARLPKWMRTARDVPGIAWMATEQERRIADAVESQQGRLRRFIRRRVGDADDAEDILQDVFYELVLAYRLMQPVEHVGAWLFRVARNRITDLFRRKRSEAMPSDPVALAEDGEELSFADLLPSPHEGPEAAYARRVLLEELDAALDELPAEQRDVFVAHEVEGRTFKQMAAETGLSINTLLSRKHYAVRHLRRRLQAIRDEFARS
jgi:RNA polymerase sigma factor (sigma-70 family)